MPRQDVIRIKAEILIPYNRRVFGSATDAEAHCSKIRQAIHGLVGEAYVAKWEPEHTSVAVAEEPKPVAPVPAPDGLAVPAFLARK